MSISFSNGCEYRKLLSYIRNPYLSKIIKEYLLCHTYCSSAVCFNAFKCEWVLVFLCIHREGGKKCYEIDHDKKRQL